MSSRRPDPRSGVDEKGRWTPAFPGQRPPFEVGNQVAIGHGRPPVHGAYADVRLGSRVSELSDDLRELIPGYRPADEPALRLLALALARLEASTAAIEGATPSELARLRQDERGWANTARRLLGDLGMTPTARAKLRLDVAVTSRVLTLTGLAEQAELEGEARETGEGDS